MKKNKLKNGMILQNRKGYKMLLVGDNLIGDDGYSPLSNYDDDLKNIVNSDFDIIKVYSCKVHGGFNRLLEDDNLDTVWEHKEVKPTYREIEVLKALKTLGYAWLARDKNGALYTFFSTPAKKSSNMWTDGDDYFFSIKESVATFSFIKWEDEEPTKIDDLLK